MIECMERNEQIVVPVFFNVNPSHLRYQCGDYGDALAKHEGKFKENMIKIQSWRSALEKASNLKGFHYPANFEDESDLIDEIVKDIRQKLNKFYPCESNGLVGIDKKVEQIQSLLISGSSEVLFLGIWGMGGIGKTTIAQAIYDKYSRHDEYDGCCFLNVREGFEQHGLSLLREKLLCDLFEGEGLRTSGISKARFFSSAGRRMGGRKVLVVLDDVTTSEQIKYLVGEPIYFGQGSRVIITSRDQDVLTSGGVHQIYEVKEMCPKDSLKLFNLHAFKESQLKMGYEKLSEEVVKIAQGNPLALTVLGSDFHSRSIDTWECALSKIKKYPNEKIQSVLRFSYDGLHEVEKKAFLDIAFFFKDDDKDYVIRQLDAWGFYGVCGIEVLQRKALLTILSDNRIQMHELIRKMGCEIVRQESIESPGRRSRLRDSEDIHDILRYNLGTDKVEAMQIDVNQMTDLRLKVDTFKSMPRLRFLKIYHPLHAELSMSSRAPVWSPDKHVALLLSGYEELMSVASEIHIKFLHYLLFDGCSGPKEISVTSKEIRQPNITRPRMEIIMNSSIGHLSSLECSAVDVQQFKNLPNELLCLRSTYYLKLSNSNGQNTKKLKLHILFDGLRYYQLIPFSKLCNPVAAPLNISALSWCREFIVGEKESLADLLKALPFETKYTTNLFVSEHF
ncbi:TMV resistance protein N-like isoform X2 [Cajanus cajan]|nr:TMV resistance protein N-like isoform X2 [Cajanus cajan]